MEWALQEKMLYCYFDNGKLSYTAINAGQLQNIPSQQ